MLKHWNSPQAEDQNTPTPLDKLSREIRNLEALQELRTLAVDQCKDALGNPTNSAPDLTPVVVQDLVSSAKKDIDRLVFLEAKQMPRTGVIHTLEETMQQTGGDVLISDALRQCSEQVKSVMQKRTEEITHLLNRQTKRRKVIHRLREFMNGRAIVPAVFESAIQEMQAILERDDKELQDLRNLWQLLGHFH